MNHSFLKLYKCRKHLKLVDLLRELARSSKTVRTSVTEVSFIYCRVSIILMIIGWWRGAMETRSIKRSNKRQSHQYVYYWDQTTN